jgi:hypothetical protein
MSNTKNEQKNSTGNGTSSTKNSADVGNEPELKVREFLYLDFSKLTSYYAQIFQGLLRSRQTLLEKERSELVKDVERELQVDFDTGAQMADGSTPEAFIARLIGVTFKLEATVSNLTKWGGDQRNSSQSSRLIETTELHHDLFALVENELYRRNLVATGGNYDSGQPFHIFKGHADLIDFNKLHDTMKNFKKMGQTFKTFTGADPSKDVANLPQIADMVRTFYSNKIGVVVTQGGQTATAYLQPDLLTSPIEFIIDTYGRYTQVEWTIFGLRAGSAYPIEETTGEVAFTEGPDAPEPPSGIGTMAASLIQTNRSMEGMDRFFRVRGSVQLFPLAVYVDFEAS